MAASQPTILIVDDTPENLLLLGHALEAEFDLAVATSGSQGMAMAALQQPDLILLDVMMPGMDGVLHKPIMLGELHHALAPWLPASARILPAVEAQCRVLDANLVSRLLAQLLPLIDQHKFAAIKHVQALVDATLGTPVEGEVAAAQRDLTHMNFSATAERLRRLVAEHEWKLP